jgi:hypothetical protein
MRPCVIARRKRGQIIHAADGIEKPARGERVLHSDRVHRRVAAKQIDHRVIYLFIGGAVEIVAR